MTKINQRSTNNEQRTRRVSAMANPVVAPSSFVSSLSSCLGGKNPSSSSFVTSCLRGEKSSSPSVVPSCRCGEIPSSSSPLLITHYSLFIEKAARRRAFTLVELLAVIAIMGILAAVAIPGFVALFRNSGQVQGVNQISAALGEAQTLALRLHTYVALVMYEQPGYTGETAFAYEYAPIGQVSYNPVNFIPYLPRSVQYLPKGTYTAGLVGSATDNDSGLQMPNIIESQFGGPEAGADSGPMPSGGLLTFPRVVVFNSSGHLVVLNSVNVVELPNATIDMSVTSPYAAYTVNVGPTTPAVLVFNVGNWPQAINGTATPGYSSPGAYAMAHSNTLTVNTYTGGTQ